MTVQSILRRLVTPPLLYDQRKLVKSVEEKVSFLSFSEKHRFLVHPFLGVLGGPNFGYPLIFYS